MRDAQSGPSSAACPASAKSATHSFSRGRKSGRHRNFPVSFQLSAEMPRFVSSTSRAPRYTSQHTSNASSGLTLMAPPHRFRRDSTSYRLKRKLPSTAPRARTHQLPANRALDLILPDRAEVLPAQDSGDHARPLLYDKPAVLRLSQMPQLRGNARRRVMRQFRQLVQRQPRLALPRAQHHVAKHVALPPPRDPQEFPSLSFSHLRLLSRRLSVLSGKLFCGCARCAVTFLIFSIVRRPRRAVRVFVIPRAGAASSHFIRPASAVYRVRCALHFAPVRGQVFLPPKFSTLFHNALPSRYS